MAGQNHFNANALNETVFDADGNAHQTTRPNARELINTGAFFRAVEDIGKPRLESDGPNDPSAANVTVYDKYGEPLEVSRQNARELTSTAEYTWNAATVGSEPESAEELAQEPTRSTAEPASKEASTPVQTTEDPLVPMETPLADIALRVTGDPDISKYLGGFSVENLRQLASERYGENIHHRSAKATIIQKIVECEEGFLEAKDSGDAV